jgi:hypothetical protein
MSLSFTLVLSIRIPIMQKLRILSLFGVGLLLIGISTVRIVEGRNSRTQTGHTLWASLEVLFAVIVAVTPTIYALIRNKWGESNYIYDRSQISLEDANHRAHSVGMVENDRYTTRIWTELENGIVRADTSVSRILVHEEWEIQTSQPKP